ncbi:MAG: hypothetical protein AAFW00_28455, partial [Bacteroidota bacterium]
MRRFQLLLAMNDIHIVMDRVYTLTNCIKGSKEYSAGLLPDDSSRVRINSFSSKTLVNLDAVGAGIPLFEVKLLLRKIGLVKIKSNALILHFDERISEN